MQSYGAGRAGVIYRITHVNRGLVVSGVAYLQICCSLLSSVMVAIRQTFHQLTANEAAMQQLASKPDRFISYLFPGMACVTSNLKQVSECVVRMTS